MIVRDGAVDFCRARCIKDGTDFSKLKTFHWYDNLKVKHPVDDLMDRRFHNAIIRTLQKQGFVNTLETPDFLVNYAVSTKTKQEYGIGWLFLMKPKYLCVGLELFCAVSKIKEDNINNLRNNMNNKGKKLSHIKG